MDLDNIQRKYGLPAPLPVVQNGKFATRFPLNLEHRGDDVFQFGGKYIGEIENIYDLLYKILTNQEIDVSLALPYAIKITEDKLYIRDKTNSEWITIFDITKPNFPKEIELYELIYKAITHQVIGEDTSYPGQFKIEENILYVRDKDNLTWTQIGDVTKEFLGATEATQAILDEINEILTEVQELKTELNRQIATANETLTTALQAANEAMTSAQSINIRTFNSVEEMKASNTLKAGALAKTLGFYTAGDGGGADYVITNDIGEDEADEATLISLQKELYAKLLLKDYVDLKQFGAKGDGETNDTEIIQKAINYAYHNGLSVFIPKGTFKIKKISFNPTDIEFEENQQRPSVGHVFGIGRRSSVLLPDETYDYGDNYAVTYNNTAGIHIHDFGIIAETPINNLADFSWIGGSSGVADLAPANLNIMENVWFENGNINLNAFQDSKISGITVRGTSGLTIQGGGGFIAISDLQAYTTTPVKYACQNGSITNAILLSGLELTGGSYNNVTLTACHFFAKDNVGAMLNSTAIGTATRGIVLNSCYFNTTDNNVVAGRFWQGAIFNGCQFNGFGEFFGDIYNGAGSGVPATFTFNYCSFEKNIVTDVPIILNKCRSSSGGISQPIASNKGYVINVDKNNFFIQNNGVSLLNQVNGDARAISNNILGTIYIPSNTLNYNEWYTVQDACILNHNGVLLVWISGSNYAPKALYAVAKAGGLNNGTVNTLASQPAQDSTHSGDIVEFQWLAYSNGNRFQIRAVNSAKTGIYDRGLVLQIQGFFGVG